ncbi:hypothetical protein N0V91_005313 [Didymella pomorum]|uniref:Uncharacterized protein n=1 Tax=Didymella pomorum TaxID=749634 RepID=A0A9W8ZD61_9PLEO|nr:hypothetical protein N0V91_005313 [Didymella pomorum]
MKISILSLACFFSAAVSAVSAMQAAPELTVRDTPEGAIDCGFCTGMFDFCVQCKKCHGEFDQCPEKSRYVN